jgi:hypothetical protein
VLSIEGVQLSPAFCPARNTGSSDQPHGYLALYEIDTDAVAETLARLGQATWLNMSDAIDPESIQISLFAATTEKQLSNS